VDFRPDGQTVKSMRRILKLSAFPFSVLLLMAADPSWKIKPIAQWTEEDARQVLAASPWVQKATPRVLPQQSEAERRAGGKMGGGQGVGAEAVSPGSLFGTSSASATHDARPNLLKPLEIRWESAGPVRAAETQSHEEDAPDLDAGWYAIAVYDVPGLDIGQDGLSPDLRRGAALSREGRKDLNPSQVDLLPQANGRTTVVYLFPRTEPITTADKRITFTAVFGHLSVAQYFYPREMQLQGRLEL
jgi:hypothetical protein